MVLQPELGPRSRRLLSRFPAFAGGGGASLRQVVQAVAQPLEELDTAIQLVLESRWVERAGGGDLDRIGSMVALGRRPDEPAEAYRQRLMRYVRTYIRYGCSPRGVLEAVSAALGLRLAQEDGEAAIQVVNRYLRQVMVEGGPADGQYLLLEELPLHTRTETVRVIQSGQRWSVTNYGEDPESAEPAYPTITITAGAPTEGLLLVNLGSGDGVGIAGALPVGKQVVFTADGKALVDEEPFPQAYRFHAGLFSDLARFETDRFLEQKPVLLTLPVGESGWICFDRFDPAEGFPSNPDPSTAQPQSLEELTVDVTISWEERRRAAFVLTLPPALEATGGSELLHEAAQIVERVRAAGVTATVRYAEPSQPV